MKFTQEQKAQAVSNVQKSIQARQSFQKKIRYNSFESWGNLKSLRRAQDTLEAMRQDRATDNQYRYWLNN